MKRSHVFSIVAAAGLVLAACGSDSTTGAGSGEVAAGDRRAPTEFRSVDELAGVDCSANRGGSGGSDSAGAFLLSSSPSQAWVAVDAGSVLVTGHEVLEGPSPDQVGGGEDFRVLVLDDLAGIDVPAGTEVMLGDPEMLNLAQDELDLGADVRIDSRGKVDPARISAGLAWSLRPDGSFLILGGCTPPALAAWADAVVEAGRADSPADAVRQVIDAADPAAAFEALREFEVPPTTLPVVAWVDQPADTRFWDLAPREVKEGSRQIKLNVVVPERWAGTSGVWLCTWTEPAWGPCLSLGSSYFDDGVEDVNAVLYGDATVEVWLLDAVTYDPIGLVGELDPARLGALAEPEVRVVDPDDAGASYDQASLEARVSGGAGVVSVEVGEKTVDNTDRGSSTSLLGE